MTFMKTLVVKLYNSVSFGAGLVSSLHLKITEGERIYQDYFGDFFPEGYFEVYFPFEDYFEDYFCRK